MESYEFLILGSNGLLGLNLVKELKKRKKVFFTIARKNSNYNLDLKNFKKLNNFFSKYKFKIVINCAAKVNIDYCEKKFNHAKLINYKMVNFLSKMSKISVNLIFFIRKFETKISFAAFRIIGADFPAFIYFLRRLIDG